MPRGFLELIVIGIAKGKRGRNGNMNMKVLIWVQVTRVSMNNLYLCTLTPPGKNTIEAVTTLSM